MLRPMTRRPGTALTAQHTLVLPIAKRAWPPPAGAVLVGGLRFAPKRELHITLIGSALGRELQATCRAHALSEALDEALDAQDWQHARSGRLRQLCRQTTSAGVRRTTGSIIELVELPAMAPFHAALGRLLGRTLAVPPPHVTLYNYGSAKGIGVASDEALRALSVRELTAGDLQSTA